MLDVKENDINAVYCKAMHDVRLQTFMYKINVCR